MNEELKITNEDIELLKEMKENCLKADVYDDEKRLLKSNVITKFLNLYNNWNELKKWIEEDKEVAEINFEMGRCFNYHDILNKMQELEGNNDK